MLPLEPHQRRYTPRCPRILNPIAIEPRATRAIEDSAAAEDDGPDRVQLRNLGNAYKRTPKDADGAYKHCPGRGRVRYTIERQALSSAISRGPTP